MSLTGRKLHRSIAQETAMTESDQLYERLRQLAVDGALVLGLVLLLAVEVPL